VEETSFTNLRDIVAALAQAQVRTEVRVEELAQAQVRTEARLETLTARVDTLAVRVEELAQAQARTEARLEALTVRVDALTARVDTLAVRMEELAQAQARTEARLETLTARVDTLTARVDTLAVRMEELAQAQLRTEHEVTHLRRTVETQLGGLGARWGIQTEEAFRNAMKTILEEVGFTAKRYLAYDTEGEVFGRPDQVELDVVIQDGKVIVLEIKSSLDRGQVHLFTRKVAFYARKTGQLVTRQVIVTPYPERGSRELAEVLG
jgi:hypothetical protein